MTPTLKLGARGADVTRLQTALKAVGYELAVDGDFGPKTTAIVFRFQKDSGLYTDGVVGPKTWAALLAAVPAEMPPAPAEMPPAPAKPVDELARAGEIAVAEAERLWSLNIIEPPNALEKHAFSRAQIDRMIRSLDGLGWTWQKPYVKDNDYQWCLAFVMTCWAKAGLAYKPHRYTFGSSTIRMDQWGRYGSFQGISAGTRPATGARMMIELDENSRPADCVFPDGSLPRAGDIALVGDGKPDCGDHGLIVVSYDAATGTLHTIEGNAGSRTNGLGPLGVHRQGVIKAKRMVGGPGYCVRRLLRPGLADLVLTNPAP